MATPNHSINSDGKLDSPSKAPPAQPNLLVEILINIVIPVLVLVYLKKDTFLGNFFSAWLDDYKSFNKLAFIIALAFPIAYGCKDFFSQHKVNFFSVLGTVNIALTGGMGLLEFPPSQIAIKEAAVPGLIGLAILISIKTPFPLVRSFVFNDQLMNVKKIEAVLDQKDARRAFEKTLTVSTLILAASSFLASCTNYFLAIIVLKSPPGTEQFNDEMARMLALSYPVNVLPAMIVSSFALYYTYRNIRKFTGLTLEEVLNIPEDLREENNADEDNKETEEK